MKDNVAARQSHDFRATRIIRVLVLLLPYGLLIGSLLLGGCSKPKTFAPGITSETIGSSVVDSAIRWRKEFPERFRLHGSLRRSKTVGGQWRAVFRLSVGQYTRDAGSQGMGGDGLSKYRKEFAPPEACTIVLCREGREQPVAVRELKWGCFAHSLAEEHFLSEAIFSQEPVEPSGRIKFYFRNISGDLWFVLEAPLEDMVTLPMPE